MAPSPRGLRRDFRTNGRWVYRRRPNHIQAVPGRKQEEGRLRGARAGAGKKKRPRFGGGFGVTKPTQIKFNSKIQLGVQRIYSLVAARPSPSSIHAGGPTIYNSNIDSAGPEQPGRAVVFRPANVRFFIILRGATRRKSASSYKFVTRRPAECRMQTLLSGVASFMSGIWQRHLLEEQEFGKSDSLSGARSSCRRSADPDGNHVSPIARTTSFLGHNIRIISRSEFWKNRDCLELHSLK